MRLTCTQDTLTRLLDFLDPRFTHYSPDVYIRFLKILCPTCTYRTAGFKC